MKLWVVIYFLGHVSVVVGPVPYGMEECKRRIVEQKNAMRDDPDSGLTVKDVVLRCVISDKRPSTEGES